MEQFLTHFAHVAAWSFFIIFLFALIGVIATLRWIYSLFHSARSAVTSGVESIEGSIRRR